MRLATFGFLGILLLQLSLNPFHYSTSTSVVVEAKKRKCTNYPNSNDDRLIEGRFAGWKDKRNHGRCNRRGTWRRAKCWRNNCGKTRICRNQPKGNTPLCLCKSGWTGDRCETAVTEAPTSTPTPVTLPPVTPTPPTPLPPTPAPTTPSPPTPVPTTPSPPTPVPPTPVPTTTPVPPTPVPPTPVPPPTPAPLTPEPPTPIPPTPVPTTPTPPTPVPTTTTTTVATTTTTTLAPTTTTTTEAGDSLSSSDGNGGTPTVAPTTTAVTPVPPTAPPSTTTPAPPTPTPAPPTAEPPGATPAPTQAPPPAEDINCVLDFSCVGNSSTSDGSSSSPPPLATPGGTIDGRTGQTLNSSVIVGELIRAEWADEDVDSFVIESRAQYFGTRPMRFTGTWADDVASFLVDSIDLLIQIITGELLLMTEYTIILENTTLSEGWALGADFVTDLDALPNTYQADTAAYQSFLDKYGTYVVVGAQYGARLRREKDKTTCDDITVNAESRQNAMLEFSETGSPPSDGTDTTVDTFITGVAGGPSQEYLNANGFAAWRAGVTTENAVPLEVEIIMIYNESIVVDPNKQNALEEAIEDRKPFEWPDLSTLICGSARTVIIVTVIVIGVLVVIGLLIPLVAIGAAIKALCKKPSASKNGEFKKVESKKVEEVYEDKNPAASSDATPQ